MPYDKLLIAMIIIQSLQCGQAAKAQVRADTLKIATYNLLNFDGLSRIQDFHRVIQYLKPDVLVVQELQSQAALTAFLNNVMNVEQNIYSAAPFMDGRDTDNGLLYDATKVQLLSQDTISTSLRLVTQYGLVAFGQQLTIFSAHLKAGSTASDQNRREGETYAIRSRSNQLQAGSNFLLVGDFNMQSASEAAFITLTESQSDDDGRFFDPINQIGDWNNNNSFVLTHTQSTRTTSFGGGASGGLDDRFDMILVSESLLGDGGIDILPGTYSAFGNDGNHFDMDVNAGKNIAVPDSVADALHAASDHLPVVADFVFETPNSVWRYSPRPTAVTLSQNYPNPFNPETSIDYYLPGAGRASLRIFNLRGAEVARIEDGVMSAGRHTVRFDASHLASGVYLYRLQTGGVALSKKLLFLK